MIENVFHFDAVVFEVLGVVGVTELSSLSFLQILHTKLVSNAVEEVHAIRSVLEEKLNGFSILPIRVSVILSFLHH